MNTLKNKLSSRKLWAAIVGVITGISMIFGLDENIINTLAGAVVTIASIASYVFAEGKIDAARVQQAQNAVIEVKKAISEDPPDIETKEKGEGE